MRMLLKVLLALLVSSSCTSTWAITVRRALVIGNDTYPGNALKNARNDAKAVAQGLDSLGYVTTLVLDVTRSQMMTSVDQFSLSIGEGDVALVYYAGHGLQMDGENMLVPTDFEALNKGEAEYQGYPLSKLLGKIAGRNPSAKIVILDACRDNPFRRQRSLRSGWSDVPPAAETFLAFGTSPGSTASDASNEDHGLFTKVLLNSLTAGWDLDHMFKTVLQGVMEDSRGRQVAWVSSSLTFPLHIDPQLDPQLPEINRGNLGGMEQLGGSSSTRSIIEADKSAQIPLLDKGGKALDEPELLNAALEQVRGLHFKEAIPILQAVLAIDPRSAIAMRLLGALLHLVDRSVEGQQMLDRAVLLHPDDALSHVYRCLVGSRLSSSEAECRVASRLRPDLAEAHVGLAIAMTSKGDNDGAYGEANTAISLDKNSPTALAVRGRVLSSRHEDELAQRDYKLATEMLARQAR